MRFSHKEIPFSRIGNDLIGMSSTFFVCVALVLILFPKIIIIPISGFKQGIRLDDIILLICTFFIFTSKPIDKKIWLALLTIIALSLVSILINPNEYVALRLLSIVRLIEYFIFFALCNRSLTDLQKIRFCQVALMYLFSISIYQWLVQPTYTGRSDAFLGGPWESSLIALLCMAFVLGSKMSKPNKIICVSLALGCILLAQSRISILAWFGIVCCYICLQMENKRSTLIGGALSLFCLIIILQFANFPYLKFEKALSALFDDYLWSVIINGIFFPEFHNYVEFEKIFFSDKSLIGRFNQYIYYFSANHESSVMWFSLLFGNGLHGGGMHVDGMYVMALVDFGIVGCGLIAITGIRLFRIKRLQLLIFSMSIVALTLDVVWVSKAMYTFIFLVATPRLKADRKDAELT